MFYNEPYFWAFLTTFFGGIFASIKLYFVYLDRSNIKRANLSASVEELKKENVQKAVDCLRGTMDRIEPMVLQHEAVMKQMDESIKMISVIEKGLNAMSADLIKRYDEFQRKIVNVTVSMEKTLGKIDLMEQKLDKFGKVIKL